MIAQQIARCIYQIVVIKPRSGTFVLTVFIYGLLSFFDHGCQGLSSSRLLYLSPCLAARLIVSLCLIVELSTLCLRQACQLGSCLPFSFEFIGFEIARLGTKFLVGS